MWLGLRLSMYPGLRVMKMKTQSVIQSMMRIGLNVGPRVGAQEYD